MPLFPKQQHHGQGHLADGKTADQKVVRPSAFFSAAATATFLFWTKSCERRSVRSLAVRKIVEQHFINLSIDGARSNEVKFSMYY